MLATKSKTKGQRILCHSKEGEELTCVPRSCFSVTMSQCLVFIQSFDEWGKDQKLRSNILKIVTLCHILQKYFVVFNLDGIKSTIFFSFLITSFL